MAGRNFMGLFNKMKEPVFLKESSDARYSWRH